MPTRRLPQKFLVAFSFAGEERDLVRSIAEAVEEALWTALKTLEESASLSRRLAHDARNGGKDWLAKRFGDRAQDSEEHAAVIRQVLAKSSMDTVLNTSAAFVGNETQENPVISQDNPHNEA